MEPPSDSSSADGPVDGEGQHDVEEALLPSAEEVRDKLQVRTIRWTIAALVFLGGMSFLTSPPLEAALLIPSLGLAAIVVQRGWNELPPPWLLMTSAVVGTVTVVWVAGLSAPLPGGSAGIAATAGVWIVHRRQTAPRLPLIALTVVGVFGLASLGQLLAAPGDVTVQLVEAVTALAVTIAITESDDQRRVLDLVVRAKDAERRASLLRERNRFAADLHDIQGHTLHVIKLKAAVAAKVQQTDPDRTRQELAAIQHLVAETIEQGRQLANSTHELALTSELANAVELLESAGIRTRVERHGDPGAREPELALVLREATTNVLRHARPTDVRIVLDTTSLLVDNDGLPDELGAHRGLDTLGDRIRASGGQLVAGPDGDRFMVTASFESEEAIP